MCNMVIIRLSFALSLSLFQTDRPTNKCDLTNPAAAAIAVAAKKTIFFNRFLTIISYCGDLVASSRY